MVLFDYFCFLTLTFHNLCLPDDSLYLFPTLKFELILYVNKYKNQFNNCSQNRQRTINYSKTNQKILMYVYFSFCNARYENECKLLCQSFFK